MDDRIAIITGPNMGGKSTFIRAVATSILLAQVGCFVPARHATLPLVDRIFVRMGASDSSTEGLSTFLTEMRQMNTILRDATPNSLVLIDELGRGTSTHDGFGIAWAVLERLKEIGCTVLFATHFHELTEMAMQKDNSGIVNYHVSAHAPANAKEVVMLYAVEPGVCERSFGIHVARTVDFPQEIIDEAEALALHMSGAAAARSSELLSGKVGGEASVGDKRPYQQDV
jgi:DNA mismatch repair protein MSH2